MAQRSGAIRGRISGPPATLDPGPNGQYGIDFQPNGEGGVFKLTSEITDMVDSKVGLFSCWFYYSSVNDIQVILNIDTSNSVVSRLAVSFNASRRLQVDARSGTSLTILFVSDTTLPVSQNTWHHLLMSWDTGNDIMLVYVDDVDIWSSPQISTVNDHAIDFTAADAKVEIGGGEFIGAPWLECLSQVWLDTNQFLDLTVAANRRLFLAADITPISLGPDGSGPTGIAPLIYLDNPANIFIDNRGTGGQFTVFNQIDDCVDSPLNQA